MRTSGVVLCLLLVPVGAAEASKRWEKRRQELPTVEQAAQAVLEVFMTRGEAALKALAERARPDPWLVADELCSRQEHDAAEAFAKAAPRPDTERLPAYVVSRRGAPGEDVKRRGLAAADELIGQRDFKRAIAVLGAIEASAPTVVSVKVNLARGHALRADEQFAQVAKPYQRAADLAGRMGWYAMAATAHLETSKSHYKNGDLEAAHASLKREQAVHERRGNKAGVAAALGSIGFYIFRRRSMFHEAIAAFEQALAINRSIRDHQHTAWNLSNLGSLHARIADYERSIEIHEEAQRIFEAIGNQKGVANCLNEIGSVHHTRGSLAKAIDCFERASQHYEAIGDRHGLSGALGNLGNAYQTLGSFEKALAFQKECLAIKQEFGDPARIAISLSNLGRLYAVMDEHEMALDHLKRALTIDRTLGDREGMAATLGSIGTVYQAQKKDDQALEVYLESLRIAREIGHPYREANALQNLGSFHQNRGEYDQALAYVKQAGEVARTHGLLRTEVAALWARAWIHLKRGEPDQTVRVVRVGVEKLQRMMVGLGRTLGAVARDDWRWILDAGILAAGRLQSPQDFLFFLESYRAAVLLEGLGGRRAMSRVVVPATLQQAHEEARRTLAEARRAYARSVKSTIREDRRTTRKALDDAQDALLAVVDRIQRTEKAAADVAYPRAAALDQVRACLGKDEVLVLYAVTSKYAWALVVQPEDARLVPLVNTDVITRAVDALDLDDLQADPTIGLDALRELIVEPLGLPASTKRVLLTPDRALSRVPFVLLMSAFEVTYIPSATTHLLLRRESAMRGSSVLALGDPYYEAVAPEPASALRGAGRAHHELGPLPGTRKEAESIGSAVLLGAEASEAGLRTVLSTKARWRAVHLACHGLIDTERPMLSSLALATDKENDGFLTALEIFRMKIPADLVVLSACETGKGKIYKTEGIVGLTRAFMFAGAPRVISSLWKVDDEATRALMVRFYELWNPKDGSKGVGAAAALKRAQEFIMNHPDHPEWKHPYYWAAWVLWGLPE